MMNKEVFITQKVEVFQEKKTILDHAGIKYKIKVINNGDSTSPIFAMFFASSRRARGTMHGKENETRFYYIYVDKKDEEVARSLIGH